MTSGGATTPAAIVLAAGQGRRMRSKTPKVLHPLCGQPMLQWVLSAAEAAGCSPAVVVIGHQGERVRECFQDGNEQWVVQEPQLGTGHAVLQAASVLEGREGLAVILSGDVPLIRPASLQALLDAARSAWGAMAVARLDTPGRLGRVKNRSNGTLERIVEAADATDDELRIQTVNAGIYALPLPELFDLLEGVGNDNAQGEYYLPDALNQAAERGREVRCVELEDPYEAWGINDRRELAVAQQRLNQRKLDELMTSGVTLVDPERTLVDAAVSVEPDCTLHVDVTLLGQTTVGRGTTLHQGVWLKDAKVGEDVEVLPYSVIEGATLSARCSIGPFARLRPGTEVGSRARIGNFVEVKNARLGEGAKASHLAYLGDATIGDEANIGAGVVTCNYDGFDKHKTEVGEGAFVGSDTMLVAPVRVGKGALTAAGSVITEDVADDALALGRARQRTIEGGAERWRRATAKKRREGDG